MTAGGTPVLHPSTRGHPPTLRLPGVVTKQTGAEHIRQSTTGVRSLAMIHLFLSRPVSDSGDYLEAACSLTRSIISSTFARFG